MLEKLESITRINFGENVLSSLSENSENIPTYDEVINNWKTSIFHFIEESNYQKGLRRPQIGGIFSALGHIRSDDSSAATIVMPTGTGKTETILSIVLAGKFERTLVIVPSDALREQTANKFIHLGLLRELNLIDSAVLTPRVLTVRQGIKQPMELKDLEEANVIVATASALAKYDTNCLSKLAELCSHLIIDEAHHVAAKTWNRVKQKFLLKPIFQFTATPFRSDGSRVDGKIIFNYPIKDAQEDGYFKKIEFHPVKEFVDKKSDSAIAKKAVSLLKADIKNGFDHILMARAGTISKAENIFQIYSEYKDLNPVLINSKSKGKSRLLGDIKTGKHKIIVCVDMLGEGFDLPQLKIAALHDVHKSINITLQFTGRFTRQSKNLGDAKFVANIANTKVHETLEELYSEDSDWNKIIKDIGTRKVGEEKLYQAFRSEFDTASSKIIDLGLTPKISTVIYKAQKSQWEPERFVKFSDKNTRIVDSSVSNNKDILIFSAQSLLSVDWSNSQEMRDVRWDLYIIFFDRDSGLIFIHSSAKDGDVKRLQALISKDAVKVNGENIFRTLFGIKRLCFQNVGLNRDRKNLRYVMYTGTDTKEAIPELESYRARKSNIFAKGYENGKKITIGCSHKGKVWAMDSGSVDVWVSWCKSVGAKILDETINTNEIWKTAMQSQKLAAYPDIAVLNVDWPEDILRKNESRISIVLNGNEQPIVNCELEIGSKFADNPKSLSFFLMHDSNRTEITSTFLENGDCKFDCQDSVKIRLSGKEQSIEDYFSDNPPVFFLADTSIIEGDFRYFSNENYLFPFDIEKVEAWEWPNIDLSIESQREAKIPNSIQYHTIQSIKGDYDLVFDDDSSGEIADIVAIKNINDEELVIDLYHCKFCPKKDGIAKPGSRVDDVYQVAGQAVKSVKWIHNNDQLFDRMERREKARLSQNKTSRIDKGDFELLIRLKKVAKFSQSRYRIIIVQPAISKSLATQEQLSILGSAEIYIKETTGSNLRVICSV
ncbi:DEAD/DEAH box helicase [Methylobacter sp. BlB1]|uniref:DEAD/DEAH box helicase n=1 Tax=Methylobacter sp. BlB1 TaxID=2785914 RepID=UPI0018944CA1|nr:DEAD/DEAH box helicase family protein [Methylobacter sp. BlB1]MBF6650427.1 DEAD/DEAH box helicase family protein [Methylobacter sp. BlB1]